ncbi:MAG: NAD(P)-binding domain-containing protein, partial [Eubacterium sp.]
MKIGFIGLGIMGRPMALKLVQHGYDVMVSDLKDDAAAEFTAEGAEFADKKKIAQECSLVGMILPNAAVVRDVIFGE